MADRLKIAYLVGGLRPGGAERQMLLLAEHLPRDEFAVTFLTLTGPAEYDERARDAGASVVPLGALPEPQESWSAGLGRRTRMARRLAHALRRGRFDVIDAWLYPADVLAAFGRLLVGTPVVMSGRRNLGEHARFGPFSGLVDRAVDRLTDAVVANSQAAADNALEHHHVDPSKMHVIRNGVEPILRSTDAARRQRRQELGVDDDAVLIACVGNYRPVKRHLLLIEAFAMVATDIPDARLVLIGSGPMQDQIEHEVAQAGLADRIRVHGPMLDVRPYYRAFDVVVQSSQSEGLPNVMLEAAAAGRAIVATDAGGTREIVVDGKTGTLVPTEDAVALAAALRRLARDPVERSRLGAAAEVHVTDAFGVDRLALEFGALYQALVRARYSG